MTVLNRIRHWFSLQGTVSREEYAITGFSLMVVKYVVEATVVGFYSEKYYSPLDFFNPLLSARSQFTADAPSWLGMFWILWTIPFVWIAVTMSIRRAVDAGASPWAGMLIFVPLINLLAMLYFAWVPTHQGKSIYVPYKFTAETDTNSTDKQYQGSFLKLRAAFAGVCVGFLYMFSTVFVATVFLNSYVAAMFYGTPLVAGATTAYIYNRSQTQSLASTVVVALIASFCFAASFLLIGIEGLICIAMAVPLMVPLGILGALVGRAIAHRHRLAIEQKERGIVACLLIVPVLIGLEPHVTPKTEFEVLTALEIAVSPEQVWQCVVSFPEITEQPEWFFRCGISCPLGARIEGAGVGATRYCDFTTGSFVEPITAWDAPRVLAFDVAEQPDPMTELSPYRHIHPPHLDGSFRSTRGEFRLVPLADGGTRLEGITWYRLEIYPHAYWTIWTDWLLHRIHGRVLRHIKQLAEKTELSGNHRVKNGRIGL